LHVTIEGVPRELKTVWLEDGMVKLIDQRYLPFDVRVYEAKTYEDVAVAIEDMVVRGAPAIGATAAYGMAQAGEQGLDMKTVADRFRKTRPTGQDLFYAIDTMMAAAAAGQDLIAAAERYASDDIDRCRKIGEHGAKLIRNGTRILTHCNAGALAAVDYGTAMAPMRVAKEQGRRFFVYVDETRPGGRNRTCHHHGRRRGTFPRPRRNRPRPRRRRPNRGERRYREQDWDVREGGRGERKRGPFLCGGSDQHDRCEPSLRGENPHRGALSAGGLALGRAPDRTEREPREEPRVRRHAGKVHHGNHYRAGDPEALTTPDNPRITAFYEEETAKKEAVGG